MTTFDDLPTAALRLITRSARTRRITGTNSYARVCRSWRDAAADSEGQEQLQLLLALEGLPADTVTSTSQWLAQHGQCVTSLHITYDPTTAPLFQQLPLSTAPLVGLARLELDGPDSLAALAPALPQLVALTHLRASISLIGSNWDDAPAVFSAQVPLQQLCPGLKSLHLTIECEQAQGLLAAPVAELLPAGLEELRLQNGPGSHMSLESKDLTSSTALRRLYLDGLYLDPDPLFHMPGLEQLGLTYVQCRVDGGWGTVGDWLAADVCTAPQHLTKLTGISLIQRLFSPMQGVAGEGAMHPLVAVVPGLCKLAVGLPRAPHDSDEAVAQQRMQQLCGFKGLKHLELDVFVRGATDAIAAGVSGVSSFQQLSFLRLLSYEARVPRPTWAAVLPHLPQLRVLGVTQDLLEGGLAPEVKRLTQLQCLYVQCAEWEWDPAARGAEVAAHLQVLSQCSSLRAVLCWSSGNNGVLQPLWEHMHQGGLHLSAWHKWRYAAEEGRVVCPRPCPHLPGVWELQQQEPADGGEQ